MEISLFAEEYVLQVSVNPESLQIETKSIASRHNMLDSLKSSLNLRHVELSSNTPGTIKCQPSSMTPYDHIGCNVNFKVEMTILDKVLLQVAGHQVDAFDKCCKEMAVTWDLIEQVEQRQQYWN
jgi:hypothetical protein